MRQERLADPAEREASKRHAKLRGGKVRVQPVKHAAGGGGAAIPLVHERVELAAANLHQRELAGDEEPVERHQHADAKQLQEHDATRVPMSGDFRLGGEQASRVP